MRAGRIAVSCGLAAVAIGVAVAAAPRPEANAQDNAEGARLFNESCSSCHGPDGRGVGKRAPSLVGVGAASVDFYVSTGRMPLSRPGIEPARAKPVFSRRQIGALTRYVTSLGPGGPPIPAVDPSDGDLVEGRTLFTDNCSGCHQIQARGGIAPGLIAPPLKPASATQIGEAIRVGPYLMPRFTEGQLTPGQVNSIARFVRGPGTHPVDRGGWGIGNVGPITEGLVAFLLIGALLVAVARVIGERTP